MVEVAQLPMKASRGQRPSPVRGPSTEFDWKKFLRTLNSKRPRGNRGDELQQTSRYTAFDLVPTACRSTLGQASRSVCGASA
jgi:hypothetical protein